MVNRIERILRHSELSLFKVWVIVQRLWLKDLASAARSHTSENEVSV
jgi:hypothetical protein